MSRYETYKPSGIDWIGNYPKHWEFRRLKNVCIVNKEALTDKTPFDYLIEYIDIGNTTDNGEFLELQEIEFSEGFGDLHTFSYKEILSGNGFGLDTAFPSINTVYQIRNAAISPLKDDYHPILKKII